MITYERLIKLLKLKQKELEDGYLILEINHDGSGCIINDITRAIYTLWSDQQELEKILKENEI